MRGPHPGSTGHGILQEGLRAHQPRPDRPRGLLFEIEVWKLLHLLDAGLMGKCDHGQAASAGCKVAAPEVPASVRMVWKMLEDRGASPLRQLYSPQRPGQATCCLERQWPGPVPAPSTPRRAGASHPAPGPPFPQPRLPAARRPGFASLSSTSEETPLATCRRTALPQVSVAQTDEVAACRCGGQG